MPSCEICPTKDGMSTGWSGDCEVCGEFRWYPGNGERIYNVPGLINDVFPLVQLKNDHGSLIEELKVPRKTRLPSKYRSSSGRSEHLEQFLGINTRPVRNKAEQLVEYRKHLEPFGLGLTQLMAGTVEESEPLLIHWIGVNPFASFPEIQQCMEIPARGNCRQDPNWLEYGNDVEFHDNIWFGNPFKPKQKEAIISILKNTGSLQIVALPTGYGKTRIIQTVAY